MNMLESISTHNFVVINGYAYFSNMFYNALFKVEIGTGKTTFLGNFKNEMISEHNIHFEIMLENNMIYFFPRRGRHVHIYHLSNEIIQTVEIRKKSESFFVIEEVVLEDEYIYFLPKQKDKPIKKMERNTYKVTNVSNKSKLRGKYLSKCRNILPADIIEKCGINHVSPISCEQMPNDKWCCFMPAGRQLLCFTEGTYDLEMLSLVIVNEVEFQKYICEVKQYFFKDRTFFGEFESFKLQDFLEIMMLSNELKKNRWEERDGYVIGKTIWEIFK